MGNATKPQPFEKYEELSAILYHAAHRWKTDTQWTALLEEINKLCLRLEAQDKPKGIHIGYDNDQLLK